MHHPNFGPMRNSRSIFHVLLSHISLRIHVATLSVGELVQHNEGNRAQVQFHAYRFDFSPTFPIGSIHVVLVLCLST